MTTTMPAIAPVLIPGLDKADMDEGLPFAPDPGGVFEPPPAPGLLDPSPIVGDVEE